MNSNKKIRIAIFSSKEQYDIAKIVQNIFNKDKNIEAITWKLVQSRHKTPYQCLVELVENDRVDFVCVIANDDDTKKKRGVVSASVRDNVIWELGFFMGSLGIERVCVLHQDGNFKSPPTDLKGYNNYIYEKSTDKNPLESCIEKSCGDIIQHIMNLNIAKRKTLKEYQEEIQIESIYKKSLTDSFNIINGEIEDHIIDEEEIGFYKNTFVVMHKYKNNIRLILKEFHRFLIYKFKNLECNESDIVISFYAKKDGETNDIKLIADCCPHNKIQTVQIKSSDTNFVSTEALQLASPVYVLDINNVNYVIKKSHRQEKLTHFIAVPLYIQIESETCTFAVLNLEFHSKEFFKTENEMKEFFREYILAYIQLLIYQILKKHIFAKIKEKVFIK